MNKQNKEKGFTLVEVLASIVILSIIVIGIFQMFIFSGNTATSNQTKLVTTHLAKATIERIKIDHESFFPIDIVEPNNEKHTFNKNNCSNYSNCDLFLVKVNDLDYEIEVTVSQNTEHEKELNLINVIVQVTQPDKNLHSKVEGYVVDE